MSSKQIIHRVLMDAMVHVRYVSAASTPATEENRKVAFDLAHLTHNWPMALANACSSEDYDQLLGHLWETRADFHGFGVTWLGERLSELGVDTADLGSPDS